MYSLICIGSNDVYELLYGNLMAVVIRKLDQFDMFNDAESFQMLLNVSKHSRKHINPLHNLCDVEPATRVRKSSRRWIDTVRGRK